ncbi:PDZ domain-containing protein [Trichonephila inaurata madagascariensis]|uniref:PDZ domain-containing protein n=1 Tax=Trichonephila inaurata madagascariensis TaxID=2747483 RepID=A0A8X6Y3H4_9ARAC|nr:PDZ domain-containing protein [Trichonephila inaurata madagascariensis]
MQKQSPRAAASCSRNNHVRRGLEDLLSPRKGKEPPVVKAVVHNPYNSPLSLYSTENIAETLAKQTEVLTEGQISGDEEGPENLSFKQKSAVFQLLEEQSKQDSGPYVKSAPSTQVRKPKTAPPPPPKPKPPSNEQYYNGYDSHQQVQQNQQRSSRVEYQTTQEVVNQYQYQQEKPIQYQQTTVYQTSSHQRSPGYQSPLRENYQEPSYQTSVSSYQHYQNQQPPATNYQQTYQKSTYQQQTQGYQSPTVTVKQQYPGYQSPTTTAYQQLNQVNYQQNQNYQTRSPDYQQTQQPTNYQQTQQQAQKQTNYQQNQQQTNYQQNQQASRQQVNYQQNQQSSQQQINYQQPTQQQTNYQKTQQTNVQQQKTSQSPTAVSKAEFKIGPPPPPRGASTKHQQQDSNMTAIYKQQYEQHLQKQYEQQQLLMNNHVDESMAPKAHIIEEDIFEHNSTSGTPITYKAPPAAPPKPNWPPPPSQDSYRSPMPDSPKIGGGQTVASAWPPKKSSAVDLPKTGFNTQAIRETGGGRRCVWPPPGDEFRSGRNTPQSPITGRRIQWNPSPSPPLLRKTVSPVRRKDINWPPSAATAYVNGKENFHRGSPKTTRKASWSALYSSTGEVDGSQCVGHADLTATANGLLLSSSQSYCSFELYTFSSL